MDTADSSPSPASATAEVERDQHEVRKAKRRELVDQPGGAYPEHVLRSHTFTQVHGNARWAGLEPGQESTDEVSVVGRVVHLRNTGKLCFAQLQEGYGANVQIMLSEKIVGEQELERWKKLVDLGDWVNATGVVVKSRRGELSVLADRWSMASKALRPMPFLHKDLSEEMRVRQRYTDLMVNADSRQMVLDRAAVMKAIRDTLHEQEYVEVETPILQLIHGGAAARPFTTHMNAFNQDMVLRIALELNLKKAVVGGIERVYEIGRIFRNEGVDSSHSPEFTMLEAYQSFGDLWSVAELTRSLIIAAARAVGRTRIETAAGVIDLEQPWQRLAVYDAASQALGEQVTPDTPVESLRGWCQARQMSFDPAWDAPTLVMEVVSELVEPTLLQPTYLHDYPAQAQPLARLNPDDPRQVLAWDLIIGGVERATGFSELIDPVIQREVLTKQSLLAAQGDPEAMVIDEDFLLALEHGAPPMGGIGLGIDRLMMLLTGKGIRETILFPHLKRQA